MWKTFIEYNKKKKTLWGLICFIKNETFTMRNRNIWGWTNILTGNTHKPTHTHTHIYIYIYITTLSYGHLHIDMPVLADLKRFTDINSVRTLDGVLKTCQEQWMIRKDGERERVRERERDSGNTMLYIYIYIYAHFIYIYIYIYILWEDIRVCMCVYLHIYLCVAGEA